MTSTQRRSLYTSLKVRGMSERETLALLARIENSYEQQAEQRTTERRAA